MDDIVVSDGELVELSEISSDGMDFFETLKRKISNLELENRLNQSYDYGKENHYKYHRKGKNDARKRFQHGSFRQENSRRRASSVLNYSIPRKKNERKKTNKRRKTRHRKPDTPEIDGNDISPLRTDTDDHESSEEELLKLRLDALKSKLSLDEQPLICGSEAGESPEHASKIVPTQNPEMFAEEDTLRIQALRSAVLKRKEFIKERKMKKMLEDEKKFNPPYSPTDFTPLDIDDGSPIGSPFNEIEQENSEFEIQPVGSIDLEISETSRIYEFLGENSEKQPATDKNFNNVDEKSDNIISAANDEEVALRSLLMESMNKKKEIDDPQNQRELPDFIASHLKKAVIRIQQKNNPQSESKALEIILSENNNAQVLGASDEISMLPDIELEDLQSVCPEILNSDQLTQQPNTTDLGFLIMDTKNIPLLKQDTSNSSRLITSFESVTKPVDRLVINLTCDEDSDSDGNIAVKKPSKRSVKTLQSTSMELQGVKSGFEKNLDSFLKTIRRKQESETKVEKIKVTRENLPSSCSTKLSGFSKASQIEYQELLKKIEILEKAKQSRLKARQMKRTKSISNAAQILDVETTTTLSQKKPVEAPAKKTDTIKASLDKISSLDRNAQLRLIEKTQLNYKNHSINLLNSTEQNLKLLEANQILEARQSGLKAKIVDIEHLLKRYRNNYTLVNNKLKFNCREIVQSQRALIRSKMHVSNFGSTCHEVGKIILGEGYSLPGSVDVDENFLKIAEETEIVAKNSLDTHVKSNMNFLAEKLRSFVTCPKKDPAVIESRSDRKSTNQEQVLLHEENSELKKNVEAQESSHQLKELNEPEIRFPEIQELKCRILEDQTVPGAKRTAIVDVMGQCVEKKLKYESKLEFLKHKATSVNKLLCPYQFEGRCNDEKCTMTHI